MGETKGKHGLIRKKNYTYIYIKRNFETFTLKITIIIIVGGNVTITTTLLPFVDGSYCPLII